METNNAKENGAGWVSNMAQMVAALECDYDRLQELDDARPLEDADEIAEYAELNAAATIDGDLMEDADAARERIIESPLSVQVRGDWYSPGTMEKPDASEFEILLSTGGPALRIRGELDQHNQPSRAWLEYQDWGTGWIQYFEVEQDTLLSFASCFYFGE